MVPPVMVTSLTVLTPPLLVTPIMWDGSTVKVTTAVSPALMVVLSSVMVAMGFPFNGMWIALVRGIQTGGGRSRRFPFDTMDARAWSGFVRRSWPGPRRTRVSAMFVARPVGVQRLALVTMLKQTPLRGI